MLLKQRHYEFNIKSFNQSNDKDVQVIIDNTQFPLNKGAERKWLDFQSYSYINYYFDYEFSYLS